MNKIFKLAELFKSKLADVELKQYRKDIDDESTEDLVDKTLSEYEGESVDVSNRGFHYGWFDWDEKDDRHEQIDLNDFEDDDTLKTVRDFVHGLDKKVNLKED